jgi:hypothetical protein
VPERGRVRQWCVAVEHLTLRLLEKRVNKQLITATLAIKQVLAQLSGPIVARERFPDSFFVRASMIPHDPISSFVSDLKPLLFKTSAKRLRALKSIDRMLATFRPNISAISS